MITEINEFTTGVGVPKEFNAAVDAAVDEQINKYD